MTDHDAAPADDPGAVGAAGPAPRTVVVTGASAGIGAAAARALHGLGAEVVVLGRHPGRTAAVAREVGGEAVVADFARLADVRAAAGRIHDLVDGIDVLVANAGGTWARRRTTPDGHEQTFQVNHLAPYLLLRLLEDRLGPGARVVTTSSTAHHGAIVRRDRLWADLESAGRYVGQLAYARSKLANLLLTRELAHRWGPRGVHATAAHPGVVATAFGRDGGATGLVYRALGRALRTPEEGADVLVWLATAPEGGGWVDGGFHAGRGPARPSRAAVDDGRAAELWRASAAALGLPT